MRLSFSHLTQLKKSDIETFVLLGGWSMEEFAQWLQLTRHNARCVANQIEDVKDSSYWETMGEYYQTAMNAKLSEAKTTEGQISLILENMEYSAPRTTYVMSASHVKEIHRTMRKQQSEKVAKS